MRGIVVVAGLIGAGAGAVAGWCAAHAAREDRVADPPPVAVAPTAAPGAAPEVERLSQTVGALSLAVDRLSARIEAIPASDGTQSSTATPADAPVRPGRAAPATAAATRVSRAREWDELTDDDLEMEADERYVACTDHSAAVQRYRALLARGGTPARRCRWSLRLGECLARLLRTDDARAAYRQAIDATSEDTRDRWQAAVELTRELDGEDPSAALVWAQIAAKSEFADVATYQRLASVAEEAARPADARAALEWLLKHARDADDAGGVARYQAQIDELGRK